MKSAIAFGPFLVLGATISLIYGEQIINWYLQLL
jgi:prepilin signal peptidase PulO-like enzyme (type II secretory pathway)